VCCNYKTPVVEALNLFRDVTGLRIGQHEWHLLRNAAEERMLADGRLQPGEHLTNGRADADRVVAVATEFAKTLGVDAATSQEFISRLSASNMSHGNAATLEEVSRKMNNNETVGKTARQPKNGKNVTKTDLIDRAGGYENHPDAGSPRTGGQRRKLRPNTFDWYVAQQMEMIEEAKIRKANEAAQVSAEPVSAGKALLNDLEQTLRDVQAHHGVVSPSGMTFDVGDRTEGGHAFVVKAASDTQLGLIVVTVGKWQNERTCNIIDRRNCSTADEVAKVIRLYALGEKIEEFVEEDAA
jgi:hypothetical protein